MVGANAIKLRRKYPTLQKRICLTDIFPESGSPSDLWEKYGLSSKSITNSIEKLQSGHYPRVELDKTASI